VSEPSPPPVSRRPWPRPSPFITLLIVLAIVIVGLLALLRMKPHPDTSPQPDEISSGTAEQRANADAKAWKDLDDRRPAAGPEKK
jgi:hypothetical protein